MDSKERPPPQRVIVEGFDMPLDQMVRFMLKWVLAAIPAAIVIALVGFIAVAAFAALFRMV